MSLPCRTRNILSLSLATPTHLAPPSQSINPIHRIFDNTIVSTQLLRRSACQQFYSHRNKWEWVRGGGGGEGESR